MDRNVVPARLVLMDVEKGRSSKVYVLIKFKIVYYPIYRKAN